jgi:hypothetical protein
MPYARATFALTLSLAAGSACAQLRIADWNVSNYNGTGRTADFQTAIYGVYQGRSMAPDVIIAQEFTSAVAVANFRALLNSAAGSPGDWNAAPFIDGPDSDSAFFYRAGKAEYLGTAIVAPGGDPQGAPRNVLRFDIRPAGYSAAATTIACYSVHMKAGNTGDDQARRLAEATAIRANADALPAGWNVLLAGDTNIQSSAQAAYQQLTGALANNRGRLFDPINTPGSWNNTAAFRFVHTQAPGASGAGMDDRFDFILLGQSLINTSDFDYIGNAAAAYSPTTWNDPAHSFRAWGNDGTSFNAPIAIAGNTMVGPVIAQALVNAAGTDASGGHLPVFLDLRVPARVGAPASVDLGEVALNSAGLASLTVSNGGDEATWSDAGIATLGYSLSGSPGVMVPPGSFTAAPGAPGNSHTFAIDTTVAGPFSGAITIESTSVEDPVVVVQVTASVVAPGCYANCDGSSIEPVLNVLDFNCFLSRFGAGEPYANCDGSTLEPVLNVLDFNCFLSRFAAGCP